MTLSIRNIQAELRSRLINDVFQITGSGVPVDGTTGKNLCGRGSTYVDFANGVLYINIGTKDNPDWEPVGGGVANPNVEVDGIAGEDLTPPVIAYLSDGSGSLDAGKWYKTSNVTDYKSIKAAALGYSLDTLLTDEVGTFRLAGEVTGLSDLVPGVLYYLDTDGWLTFTPPTTPNLARPFAVAHSTSAIVIIPHTEEAGVHDFASLKRFSKTSIERQLASGGSVYHRVPGFHGGNSGQGNITTGENAIASTSLEANTLLGTWSTVKFRIAVVTANNGNTKTLRLYFGSTLLATFTCLTSQSAVVIVEAVLHRTGSNAQKVTGYFMNPQIGGTAHKIESFSATATETDTAAKSFYLTAQGSSTNDLVCESYHHELW